MRISLCDISIAPVSKKKKRRRVIHQNALPAARRNRPWQSSEFTVLFIRAPFCAGAEARLPAAVPRHGERWRVTLTAMQPVKGPFRDLPDGSAGSYRVCSLRLAKWRDRWKTNPFQFHASANLAPRSLCTRKITSVRRWNTGPRGVSATRACRAPPCRPCTTSAMACETEKTYGRH